VAKAFRLSSVCAAYALFQATLPTPPWLKQTPGNFTDCAAKEDAGEAHAIKANAKK
jgi:hypothetical protein